MKKHSVVLVMIAMLAALWIPAAFAQATGTVKGVARDMQGNPIVGATVEWYNTDNGRKYTLKTNKKGEYFSLGIEPGKYKVTLLQDGKQLDSVNGYGVKVDENTLDFDEKQSQAEAAKQKGISQEQLKQMQEAQEKQAKEVTTVKSLNEKLQAANQSIQTQDFGWATPMSVQLRSRLTLRRRPDAIPKPWVIIRKQWTSSRKQSMPSPRRSQTTLGRLLPITTIWRRLNRKLARLTTR
jgi:Carboxypeptidase regulatory-like domain